MNDKASQKIMQLHEELRYWWKDLCRISIALYNEEEDLLNTFIASNDHDTPLNHYQVNLSDVPSLQQLATSKSPRVITDLRDFEDSHSKHTQVLLAAGIRSSYTLPIISHHDTLLGFLFFNADLPDYFSPELTKHLEIYAQLVMTLVESEINQTRILNAALSTAKRFTSWRDEETGTHLARVSHYSSLIATSLAQNQNISDEFIEYLYQFAPLHDIGKIAIPDNILLKRGQLDAEERAIMDSHVTRGCDIVDDLIANFALQQIPHVDILHNVVLFHHERWDGSGYLHGLSGKDIPLEARIVSVADCFDALMSERPYKKPWSYEDTRQHMLEGRGTRFDPDCVNALFTNEDRIQDIRTQFADPAT